VVGQNEVVGRLEEGKVGGNVDVGAVGGEVPHGVVVSGGLVVGVGVAPDELLDWVVVRQTDEGSLGVGSDSGGDRVSAGVLELLNQVLVTLLGEAAALLGVQVHVLAPDLKGGLEEVAENGGQIEVQADLVVLKGNQGKVQAWVAVEEEEEGEVHADVGGLDASDVGVAARGNLAPLGLVHVVEEDLGIQTPPCLVVLVDALTANGQLEILNGALSNPVVIRVHVVAGVVKNAVAGDGLGGGAQGRGKGNIHVADQVTVAGNGHRHAIA